MQGLRVRNPGYKGLGGPGGCGETSEPGLGGERELLLFDIAPSDQLSQNGASIVEHLTPYG